MNATGRSGERITSSPAGISVTTGSSGSASFNVGTSVTLSVSGGRRAILVWRVLQRGQQDDQLHLYVERRVNRERERAVTGRVLGGAVPVRAAAYGLGRRGRRGRPSTPLDTISALTDTPIDIRWEGSLMRKLLRRLWYVFHQQRAHHDLTEELAFHRDMAERKLQSQGAEPHHAALAARRALGSPALAHDQAHDVWVPPALQGFGHDFRLAVRTLVRTPVVSIVAALSLALGIGVNTAIFSLIDGLLLRTLPVKDPARLVLLTDADGENPFWSHQVCREIDRRSQLFDGTLAWSDARLNLAQGGETRYINGLWVSGSFFDVLGVPPLLGRTLSLADDVPGGGKRAGGRHQLRLLEAPLRWRFHRDRRVRSQSSASRSRSWGSCLTTSSASTSAARSMWRCRSRTRPLSTAPITAASDAAGRQSKSSHGFDRARRSTRPPRPSVAFSLRSGRPPSRRGGRRSFSISI